MRRLSKILPTLYLMLVVASFFIMLLTRERSPMSGLYLVVVTFPWPLVLSRLQDFFRFSPDHPVLNGLFLLAGGAINTFLIHQLFSFRTRRRLYDINKHQQ